MKKKEFNQLKEKNPVELEATLRKLKGEALNLRLDVQRGKIKNVHAYFSKRKEISQVMTLLSEKRLAAKGTANPDRQDQSENQDKKS